MMSTARGPSIQVSSIQYSRLSVRCASGDRLLVVSNAASADADQLTSIIEREHDHPFGDSTLIVP